MPRFKTLLSFQVAPECKYQPETTQKEQYEHDGSADVLPRTDAVVIWLFVNRHSRWLEIDARGVCFSPSCPEISESAQPSRAPCITS
jgi:hypothetical protein